MRKILIAIAFFIELFSISKWNSCWLFKDFFYFTPKMLTARVIDAINLNSGAPVLLIHIMHNKIIYFLWGSLQTQLEYWDVRFLQVFIGVIGFFGIMFVIWYLLTSLRKNFYIWLLIVFYIIISFVEAFFQPNIVYFWKLVIFGGLLELLSLIGLWQFLKPKSKEHYLFIVFLLVISVCALILFPLSYQSFCLKI
jgi:hypothetical protein